MARDKRLDYRNDGFIYALLFLQEHTLEELEQELYLRDKTGIKTVLTFTELNEQKATHYIDEFIFQAQNLIWCVALRKIGFGKSRIMRNLERVTKNRPTKLEHALCFKEANDKKLREILESDDYRDVRKQPESATRSVLEYVNAREDGINYAYNYIKQYGLPEFKRLITKTKYTVKMVEHENRYANDMVHSLYNENAVLEWLVSLHDLEGFGNKRMHRVMDAFEEVYLQIVDGKEGYENYLEELEQVLGFRLQDDALRTDDRYPKIAHKKKKPKKKKPKKSKVQLPPIVEPEFDFMSCPCFNCSEKQRCRTEGYRRECTCLELYKEVRKTNVRQNLGIA